MSTKTKGFFEQDHRQKSRPNQWPRQNGRPALNETSGNAPPAKPPIPATKQAKAKLQTFQFSAGAAPAVTAQNDDSSASPNKDIHQESMPERSSENAGEALDIRNNVPDGNVKPLLNSPPPSTPAPRLPLEDLIGNVVAKKAQPQDHTPEETIGWIPNSSSNLLTPNRRKRKRARSSSPSCPSTSQKPEGMASFGGVAMGQIDNAALEADPAADLWQRYGGKQASGESRLPDFSHLLVQESPSMLKTPVKASGLRRWASTGNDWPSCPSKKRRTETATNVAVWQLGSVTEAGAQSRLAAMVEKVQESLATQKLANAKTNPSDKIDGPSSSSPLPEIGASDVFVTAPAVSPLSVKQPADIGRAAHATAVPMLTEGDSHTANEGERRDEGTMNPNTAQTRNPDAMVLAPLHLQSKARLPAYKRPSVKRVPSGSGVQYPQRSHEKTSPKAEMQPANKTAIGEQLEEFGEDFDFTAEDLEELMDNPPPLHERPLHQIPPHPNPPPQTNYFDDSPDEQSVLHQLVHEQVDDDDDEFGGDDIDEDAFAQAEIQATQKFRPSPNKKSPRKHHKRRQLQQDVGMDASPTSPQPNRLQRYSIRQVIEGEYTNERGVRLPEKLLVGEDDRGSRTAAITLRDSWNATSVAIGNVVHIANIGAQVRNESNLSSPPGQITVSDSDNSPLIIVHPDHMLSATTVADSFDCIRKAVLQDRIKATNDTNKAMVYGKILHEIVQQALSANQWTEAFLDELVEMTVLNHLEGLWALGMRDTVLAVEEIRAKMGELAAWARIFVTSHPTKTSLVDDRQGEQIWMVISKLIAIEEHIWSPRFGLKGNIDATVQATLRDHPNGPDKKLVMPFEVKTGKATHSPSHRAQTALYTLLLSDRYDFSVEAGILYYLESSAMSRIAPPVLEIRQMVQQRNRLAAYIHRARHPRAPDVATQDLMQNTQEVGESGFPGMLKNAFKCGRCYAQQSCFTYHALTENGTADSAGMVDDKKKNYSMVWQEAVGHLKLEAKDKTEGQRLRTWFTKWDKLLTFEERDLSRMSKEVWTMSSSERASIGRCFGNLLITHDDSNSPAIPNLSAVVDGIQGSGGRINRFTYTFVRADRDCQPPFTDNSQLVVGEPIVVSSESGQWALANGYIVALSKYHVSVAVDRKLGDARKRLSGFDEANNQTLQGIMDVQVREHGTQNMPSDTRYRLDKDEFSNGLALVRNNLVALMSSHPINTKLRNQVVLNTPPSFSTPGSTPVLPPSQIGQMNDDQRAAISKVLATNDYALILGMPGTGKTTTIAHLIRALLAEEKTILLTSFTHTAVDNILLKIRDIAPPRSILRLGVPAKIHPEVQTFSELAAASGSRRSIEEIDAAYMDTKIVATTCMGTNHALFTRRAFDICIVDEASQITLPTSLGPLLHARKFVLVGDHYQLPPLVQNKAALEGGLDVSLFRQISEQHPQAVAKLGEQYRMCEEIMSLSNTLIYDGQLRCGTVEVASRTLQVDDMGALQAFHRGSTSSTCSTIGTNTKCWLKRLTSPEHKVVFANTDRAKEAALETLTSGKTITNVFEATLSAQLVLSLLAVGVPAKEIGVITLYRSQLSLIRQLFKSADISADVEIDSADRFQGRDKECIILSMVRSNESGIVGDLLKDWRRVNVALTRARSKLVILGSRNTLRHNELLLKLLDLVDGNGWTTDLPADAVDIHNFAVGSETASSIAQRSSGSGPVEDMSRHDSPSKSAANARDSRQVWKSSPPTVLQPSQNAGNRRLLEVGKGGRQSSPKIIKGQASGGGLKARKMKEQIAMEIFEDITADDL